MDNSILGPTLLMLAAAVWLVAGILQWCNLRKQEQLLATMERNQRDADRRDSGEWRPAAPPAPTSLGIQGERTWSRPLP